MTDRYIVTSRSEEHVIQTNSPDTAERYLTILGGQIIDTQKEKP